MYDNLIKSDKSNPDLARKLGNIFNTPGMGNAFESFRRKYFPYKGRVVLAGEYGSGRTTALYKMRLDDVVKTIPTIGFNVENLYIGGTNIEAWDIGGNTNARRLWHHYF